MHFFAEDEMLWICWKWSSISWWNCLSYFFCVVSRFLLNNFLLLVELRRWSAWLCVVVSSHSPAQPSPPPTPQPPPLPTSHLTLVVFVSFMLPTSPLCNMTFIIDTCIRLQPNLFWSMTFFSFAHLFNKTWVWFFFFLPSHFVLDIFIMIICYYLFLYIFFYWGAIVLTGFFLFSLLLCLRACASTGFWGKETAWL